MNPESRSTLSLIANPKTQTRTFQLVPRLGEDHERRGRESGVHGGDWKTVAVGSGLNDWLGCLMVVAF